MRSRQDIFLLFLYFFLFHSPERGFAPFSGRWAFIVSPRFIACQAYFFLFLPNFAEIFLQKIFPLSHKPLSPVPSASFFLWAS